MSHTSQGGQYQRSSSAPSERLSTRPGTTPGKSACHTFSALHLSLAHALGARRSTDPASTGRWYGERSKGHGLKDPGFVDSAGSTGPWYGGRIKGHGLKDLGEGAKPVAEVPDVTPPWFAHPMSKTEDPGTSNAGQPSAAARPATQGQAQPQWAVRRMPPTAGVASVQQRRSGDSGTGVAKASYSSAARRPQQVAPEWFFADPGEPAAWPPPHGRDAPPIGHEGSRTSPLHPQQDPRYQVVQQQHQQKQLEWQEQQQRKRQQEEEQKQQQQEQEQRQQQQRYDAPPQRTKKNRGPAVDPDKAWGVPSVYDGVGLAGQYIRGVKMAEHAASGYASQGKSRGGGRGATPCWLDDGTGCSDFREALDEREQVREKEERLWRQAVQERYEAEQAALAERERQEAADAKALANAQAQQQQAEAEAAREAALVELRAQQERAAAAVISEQARAKEMAYMSQREASVERGRSVVERHFTAQQQGSDDVDESLQQEALDDDNEQDEDEDDYHGNEREKDEYMRLHLQQQQQRQQQEEEEAAAAAAAAAAAHSVYDQTGVRLRTEADVRGGLSWGQVHGGDAADHYRQRRYQEQQQQQQEVGVFSIRCVNAVLMECLWSVYGVFMHSSL